MKTRTIGVATLLLLPIFFSFASFATADNVTITIKGGINLKVTITNEKTSNITAYINFIAKRIFRPAWWNSTGNGTITLHETLEVVYSIPQISSFNIVASADNQTVERKGISIFHFVILFR